MKTVSQAYLDALIDERALLNRLKAEGGLDLHSARGILANCKATRARGWTGEIAESMRASADFWRLQVKKMEAKTA